MRGRVPPSRRACAHVHLTATLPYPTAREFPRAAEARFDAVRSAQLGHLPMTLNEFRKCRATSGSPPSPRMVGEIGQKACGVLLRACGRGPLRRSDLIATVAKFTLRVPERAHNLLQRFAAWRTNKASPGCAADACRPAWAHHAPLFQTLSVTAFVEPGQMLGLATNPGHSD